MKSITEEMRFRQRLCEYALKHGVTKAARRYHTNRQFVYLSLIHIWYCRIGRDGLWNGCGDKVRKRRTRKNIKTGRKQ